MVARSDDVSTLERFHCRKIVESNFKCTFDTNFYGKNTQFSPNFCLPVGAFVKEKSLGSKAFKRNTW